MAGCGQTLVPRRESAPARRATLLIESARRPCLQTNHVESISAGVLALNCRSAARRTPAGDVDVVDVADVDLTGVEPWQ